jgi:hypothetical protein
VAFGAIIGGLKNPRVILIKIKKFSTSILCYMQYFNTKLHVRKAWVLINISSLNSSDIQFVNEYNISIITNTIFYLTFFFILYKIKKNLAKLVYIGTEFPKYQNNFLFNKALDYFNMVINLIFFLVIISLIVDCSYLIVGELFTRTPLDYTRIFKLFIAIGLFILNIVIKRVSGENINKWDIAKGGFLITPLIIQIIIAYGFLTSFGFLTLLNTLISFIDLRIHELMTGELYKVGEFKLEDHYISPNKEKSGNIHTMDNNGENSNAESSSGGGNSGNSGSNQATQTVTFKEGVWDAENNTFGMETRTRVIEKSEFKRTGLPKDSATRNLIDALDKGPVEKGDPKVRPSTSEDRSSSDVEGRSSVGPRPASAPETRAKLPKPEQEKKGIKEWLKGKFKKGNN